MVNVPDVTDAVSKVHKVFLSWPSMQELTKNENNSLLLGIFHPVQNLLWYYISPLDLQSVGSFKEPKNISTKIFHGGLVQSISKFK